MHKSSPFLLMLLAGCAVGPSYERPVVAPESGQVTIRTPDSVQAKLDTVMLMRDSLQKLRTGQTVELKSGTSSDVAWLNLLQDTVLVQLVRRALDQNRDIQVAMARVREARALAGAAKGPLFPQLYANGSASANQVVFGTFGTQRYDALILQANLQWEIDFWGGIRRSVQAANFDAAAVQEGENAVRLTLVADVATAYVELRELDDDLAISLTTLESRRETLRIARRRYEQGLISELDVRQFEAEVAGPAAAVAFYTRAISQKENQLRVLLGEGPGAIPRGLPLVEVVRGLNVPDSLPATLVAQRPDVKRADREAAASSARIGVAIANRLPQFLVTGSYGTQATGTGTLFKSSTETYLLQGGISIPLFTGGRLVNEQRAAVARADQFRSAYEQTVLVALGEVSDALVGVRTSRDQAAALDLQVAALERAQALATLRYQSGLSSYLDLLDAQRALYTAQLAQAETRRLRLVSAVQLYKALGGSWTQDTTTAQN
jgi:multidrug efflux system outer membrane protein